MPRSNAANTAAVATFRRRMSQRGLMRLDITCHREDAPLIKALARQLKEKRKGEQK